MAVGCRSALRRAAVEAVEATALLLTTCAVVACAFNVDFKSAVQVPTPSEAADGYFGYSVALVPPGAGGPSLLVGAPRASSSLPQDRGLTATGATYRCQLTSENSQCSQLHFEARDYIRSWGNVERNDSFLGAAIDVQSNGDVVVCNPKWKMQETGKNGYRLQMPGACFYTQTPYSSSTRIINKDARREDPQGSPNLFSQMGFSVNFVGNSQNESSHILMGAPGAWTGKGTAALLDDFKNYSIHPRHPVGTLSNFSYFGYSVGAGRFGPAKELLYVSGAPRAEMLKGKVFLFTIKKERDEVGSIEVFHEFGGGQPGEYFGASVATADLNGDKMDDLLVGAPQWSHRNTGGDEGGVYVYVSNPEGKLTQVGEGPTIMGSEQPNARFGTTISALGDINHDGFQDFAVSAPYEDELRGAVYIYHGRRRPPYLKLVQIIMASDISDSFRGFGYSISRGTDIDNNSYNDFAVGAYLSNHAVVLRTSPIIYVNSNWTSDVSEIKMSREPLNLQVCLSFGGYNLSDPVQVEVRMQMDPVYNRAYFSDSLTEKIYNANLKYGKYSCEPVLIVPKNFTKILKPLEIVLRFTATHTSFCPDCPVLDPENSTATLYVPYETDCKSKDCKIDIVLHGDFVDAPALYLVGNGSKIEFAMSVSNSLEPSYETNISVNITEGISLSQIHRSCKTLDRKEWNVTALLCSVPNTLKEKVPPENIHLSLDGNSAPWGVGQLVVSARAEGAGEEMNPEDNMLERTLPLHHEAELYTVGRSQPPSLSYTAKINRSDEIIFQDKFFKHTYQVYNEGPSPVDDVIIRFMIPSAVKLGSETFNLTSVDGNRFPDSINCRRSFPDDPIGSDIIANASLLKSDFELPDTYLLLDCSLSNVQCLILECSVRHSVMARSGVSVSLEMTALLKQLGPAVEEGAILLHTWGVVESAHIKNKNLPNKKSDACITQTLFLGQRPTTRMQPWIIVVAILFGILLLALVVLVLWKIGFFKRKTFMPLEENETMDSVPNEPLVEKESGDP